MSTADEPKKIGRAWTVLKLLFRAAALKMKVSYLRFRLWRAKFELNGFDSAIEMALERMHEACQKDASLAFERILGEIPVDDIGLPPGIVQSLRMDDIVTMKGIGKTLFDIQSVPNIGPMRAQMIEKAYARRLDKAALQSCHTIMMIEEIRNYIAFRDSVTASKHKHEGRLHELRARAAAYHTELGLYLATPHYRKESYKAAKHLSLDAEQFLQEIGEAIKRAKNGQAYVILMDRRDRAFQAMAAELLGEITFKLSCAASRRIEVQDGEIISD